MKPHDNKHLESQLRQLSEVFTLIGETMNVLDERFAPSNAQKWFFSGGGRQITPYVFGRLSDAGADKERCLYLLGSFVDIFKKEATYYLDKKWGFGGHFKFIYLEGEILSLFFPGLKMGSEVFACTICTEGRLKRGDRLGEWEVVKVSEDGKEATIAWRGDLTKTIPIALSFIDNDKKWLWVYDIYGAGITDKKWGNIGTHDKWHLRAHLRQLSEVFTLISETMRTLVEHFAPAAPKLWFFGIKGWQMCDYVFERFLEQGADEERAMYLTRLFIRTLAIEAQEYFNKKWGFGGHFDFIYLPDYLFSKLFPQMCDIDAFIGGIYVEGRLKQGAMLGEWEVIQVSEDGEAATIVWKRDRTQVVKIRQLFFKEQEQKWVWTADNNEGGISRLGRVSKFDNSLDIFRMN